MSSLAPFRILSVQLALLLTMVAGGLAWALFGQPPAQGLLMGGIGSALVFWLQARSVEKLANAGTGSVHSRLTVWQVVRLAVYAVILTRAYYLDPAQFTGLIGAIIGLFMIVVAVAFLGVTGLDLKPDSEEND